MTGETREYRKSSKFELAAFGAVIVGMSGLLGGWRDALWSITLIAFIVIVSVAGGRLRRHGWLSHPAALVLLGVCWIAFLALHSSCPDFVPWCHR